MKKLLSLLTLTAILTAAAFAGRNETLTGATVVENGSLTIKLGVDTTISGTSFTITAGAKTALQDALSIQPLDADLTGWAAKAPYAGTLAITAGKTLTASNTLTISGSDGSTLNVGTGGTLGTAAFVDRITLMRQFLAQAPTEATSTGTAGDVAYDNGYLYICVATNTWKRVAIATWPE